MNDQEQQREAVEAEIWENVRLGYLELVGVGEDGEPTFRLTDAGRARVEAMGVGDQS